MSTGRTRRRALAAAEKRLNAIGRSPNLAARVLDHGALELPSPQAAVPPREPQPEARPVMDIDDLLPPRSVIAQLRAGSKRQVLQELARRAAATTGVPERLIYDTIAERERLGSTGIGNGIAIPHGKLPELTRLYGLFARLERPVPFDAVDDQPVDLVFLLLAPTDAGADHLKALARVSRLLRDRATCEKLRGTDTPDALYALLTASPAG
jgi:PTS system nitrogen regulatory IIA component